MSRVFIRKQFSDYLGEQRAIDDIVQFFEPDPPVVYVAAGSGTNSLAYSFNGLDWFASTNGNSIFTSFGNAVEYANSLWVVGGQGINQLAYSIDGKSYTQSSNGNIFNSGATFARTETIVYGNSIFVAGLSKGTGGSNPATIIYSNDGITWNNSTNATSVMSGNCSSIVWNGSIFVAAGGGLNTLIYSYDGLDWSASTNGNTFGGVAGGLATDGSRFISTSNITKIIVSDDGITWSASTNGNAVISTNAASASYGNGVWVVGASFPATNRIVVSNDGFNWSASTNGNLMTNVLDFYFDGTKFFALGQGNRIMYSYDGFNWTNTNNAGVIFTTSARGMNSVLTP
jgi:hypothetical protein